MRQYVIDELRITDYEKIKAWLDENYGEARIPGIYWIPVSSSLLNDNQRAHHKCQPHYFAVEIESDRLSCEFLIRTPKTLKCSCMAYASKKQRDWIIHFAESILEKLGIVF